MHNKFMKQGQALVIVLLILAVASALGLSAVSRSVNEVNLSVTQDDSSQALSAAESGIEAVLKENLAGTPLVLNTTGGAGYGNYKISATTALGNTTSYEVNKYLASGESAPLFLKQVDPSGNFTNAAGADVGPGVYNSASFIVCWGKTDAVAPFPALEVNVYYRNGSGTHLKQAVSLFESVVGRTSGSTAAGSATGNCTNFAYENTVTVPTSPNVPLLATFRMLYNTTGHPVSVVATGAGTFPTQGNTYEVEGTAGQTTRRISVTETYPAPLGILDNALFSGTNL